MCNERSTFVRPVNGSVYDLRPPLESTTHPSTYPPHGNKTLILVLSSFISCSILAPIHVYRRRSVLYIRTTKASAFKKPISFHVLAFVYSDFIFEILGDCDFFTADVTVERSRDFDLVARINCAVGFAILIVFYIFNLCRNVYRIPTVFYI